MARISTYPLDTEITDNDKVLGTDSGGSRTKNFKIKDVFELMNRSSVVESTGSRFKYTRPGSDTTEGYIKFETDQGINVGFNTITSFKIHNQSLRGDNISALYGALVDSQVLIQKAGDPSVFGVFVWKSSQVDSKNTSQYDITLEFKGGNGALEDEQDYLLSLLLFKSSDATDKNHVHTQDGQSATWTINHGLNKKPSVTIVNTFEEKIFGEVEYVDLNNVKIYFAFQASGKAFFN